MDFVKEKSGSFSKVDNKKGIIYNETCNKIVMIKKEMQQ